MLKNLKQAGNMMGNVAKAKQQQAKLLKILQGIRVTGTSKNSKVSVTITGEQKIVDVTIDPSLISFVYENFIQDKDQDTVAKGQKFMSGPIKEAMDDALSKIQRAVIEEMQKTGSMADVMDTLKGAMG